MNWAGETIRQIVPTDDNCLRGMILTNAGEVWYARDPGSFVKCEGLVSIKEITFYNNPDNLLALDEEGQVFVYNFRDPGKAEPPRLLDKQSGPIAHIGSTNYSVIGTTDTGVIKYSSSPFREWKSQIELEPGIYQVHGGWDHYALLDDKGGVWTGGTSNSFGQLGREWTEDKYSLERVSLPEIHSLFVGGWQNYAIDTQQRTWVWGCNAQHRLGQPDNVNTRSPALLQDQYYQQISSGRFHTFALDSTGRLLVFGPNNSSNANDTSCIIRELAPLSIRSAWSRKKSARSAVAPSD